MDFTISKNATILDTLKKIDELSSNATRLAFVVDENNKVIGSVSDGDCRRGLINGKQLTSSVTEIMNTKFTSLKKDYCSIRIIFMLFCFLI